MNTHAGFPQWIGVDLDGTLATHSDVWDGVMIEEPIMPMVYRVRRWLAEGRTVRILTARVARCVPQPERSQHYLLIREWTEQLFGQALEVTSEKDPGMIVLWDDRAVQVVRNTGKTPEELGRQQYTRLPGEAPWADNEFTADTDWRLEENN